MAVNVNFEEGNLAVIRSSGVLTRPEVDQAKRQVHDHIVAHGKVLALIIIEDGFVNLEAFAKWDDIEVDAVIQPTSSAWRWSVICAGATRPCCFSSRQSRLSRLNISNLSRKTLPARG